VTAFGCSEIEIRDDPPTVPEPTPTIEVRVDPPEVAPPRNNVAGSIQGEWTVSQAYDVEDERVWISGTLTIEGELYAFEPAQQVDGPSVQGTLDFLFDTPTGRVAIRYEDGVSPGDDFWYFASGDTLAVCQFYAGSEVVGEFLIRVGDSSNLYFHSPSSEVSLWSVTKQVEPEY
jgi:outer membrane protein assembly factor BamB